MKKLLLIFVVLGFLATAGTLSYAYYIYIPEKIEQKIISSFNKFGFDDLSFEKITRHDGYILFSNISLDKQQFSAIKEIRVHYSLYEFFTNTNNAKKIIIKGLNLTGELSQDLEVTISGWENNSNFLQHVRNIPAPLIIIENSSIDLLSYDLGGINVNYDGQIHLSKTNNIVIKGRAYSKQKKLTFQAKVNGDISPHGNLSITAETDQISLSQDNLSIKRGAATLNIKHSARESSKPSLSIEADIASVNWHDLPLRGVHSTFEGRAGNYNLNASGTIFGSEHIEWTRNINKVDGLEKTQTTITPEKFSDILSFLKRNKRLHKTANFPSFLLNLKQPTVNINTITSPDKSMEGKFKFINSSPDFEIDGSFTSDDKTKIIRGNFSAESDNSEAKNIPMHFAISSKGDFIINTLSRVTKLNWNGETIIKDGYINYGALMIPNIAGKFSFNSTKPDNKRNHLNFKLPLSSKILQKGKIKLNLLNNEQSIFKYIALKIYGGQIKTQKPILKNGTIIKNNKLSVSDINLMQLFYDAGFKDIFISGYLGGVIPFKVKNNKIIVNGGILQSQGNGIIKLPNDIIMGLFPGKSRKMFMIRKALQNYHYEFFEIRLDGDLTGRVMMTLNATGYNPNIKNEDQIDLNLQIETQISLLFKNLLK